MKTMKMKKIGVVFVVVIMVFGLYSEQANAIILSTMSSDETDPSVLDAEILFEVVGSALTIKVTNTTTDPDPYDITEIYFNASDPPKITGLTLTSGGDWELVVGDGDPDTKADGFGVFDYLIRTTNNNADGGIEHGDPLTSFTLTIAGSSPWSQSDFDDEWSVPPPPERLALVAMKFVRGPGDDSAFGAVPEPATVALLGLGSLALLRRRKNS